MLWLGALLVLMGACRSHPRRADPPPAARLHLSFDDAPWMDEPGRALPAPAVAMSVNEAIVATLEERGVPSSVFVNCDRLQDGERSVELWADAGAVVGNHTSDHANLADTPLDTWIDDIARCHGLLAARLDEPPRWFRYPYLSEGDTARLRDGARARLAEMGYANAHVTAPTTEWLLAFAYRFAKQGGDDALMADVVDEYRRHVVRSVEQARELARTVVGRETPHVVVIHVNELAADHLPALLDDLRAGGWQMIGIEEALDDPVFELPDRYVGREGRSWLARIEDDPQGLHHAWFRDEQARLLERFGYVLQPPGDTESE